MIICKTREQIAKMRDAGKIVAEVLALMEEYAKPGISTAELDQIADFQASRQRSHQGCRCGFFGDIPRLVIYNP